MDSGPEIVYNEVKIKVKIGKGIFSMGIVVIGAVFVDIKGYPLSLTSPAGATLGGWSRCTAV